MAERLIERSSVSQIETFPVGKGKMRFLPRQELDITNTYFHFRPNKYKVALGSLEVFTELFVIDTSPIWIRAFCLFVAVKSGIWLDDNKP